MKRRIRLLGGGLAIVLLSACNGEVMGPEATERPAASRVANDDHDNPRADSAVARKKGRYAMGAN